MKKNLRKIPDHVLNKLKDLENNIRAEVILQLSENELMQGWSEKFGIKLNDQEVIHASSYLPEIGNGRYSKRNVRGYSIGRRDLPKIPKTFYLGERHPFGDTNLPTFSLYVTKNVFQKDEYGPKNNSILISLLKEHKKEGKRFYIFKFTIEEVLNKEDHRFEESLLFNLNLLQENVGKCDVFSSNTSKIEYLKTINVAWELLPPGQRDSDLVTILSGVRKLDEKLKAQITERYDFLLGLGPKSQLHGLSGMSRYFGFVYNDNLVVLENLEYGNALYVLYENWQELSQLSRTELFNRAEKDYDRVVHHKKWWKHEVKNIIENKLRA